MSREKRETLHILKTEQVGDTFSESWSFFSAVGTEKAKGFV